MLLFAQQQHVHLVSNMLVDLKKGAELQTHAHQILSLVSDLIITPRTD